LISQLLDPVVDPWLDRETCYNLISIPESYTGPRISFPLSVSDTNSLLRAFKEQQVLNMVLCVFTFLFMIVCFNLVEFLPHRLYMPDMFCSCCTRPKSSSNRCQTSSICQHPTPTRSLYVVSGLNLLIPDSVLLFSVNEREWEHFSVIVIHSAVGHGINEFPAQLICWLNDRWCL